MDQAIGDLERICVKGRVTVKSTISGYHTISSTNKRFRRVVERAVNLHDDVVPLNELDSLLGRVRINSLIDFAVKLSLGVEIPFTLFLIWLELLQSRCLF